MFFSDTGCNTAKLEGEDTVFRELELTSLQMRMLAFLVLVLVGALAGWAVGQDEAQATRLVLAAVGALVGAAVGGALLKIGRGQVSRSLTGNPIPGSGVTSEDLAANYWRDKGHPPFMKPPEGDPPSRGPD